MHRPRLLVREAFAPQNSGQALRRDPFAEPPFDEGGKVRQRPARQAVHRGVGALEDPLGQKRELAIAEGGTTSGARTVDETRQTFGIIAGYGIAQRLTLDACRSRCIRGSCHRARWRSLASASPFAPSVPETQAASALAPALRRRSPALFICRPPRII